MSWVKNSAALGFLLLLAGLLDCQVLFNSERDERLLNWCTVNAEEQRKCEAIADYLRATSVVYPGYQPRSDVFQLQCNQTYNKDECMLMLDNNLADITTLDPGEVFVGGRYHSLVPILTELYRVEGGSGTSERMQAVAVVRRSLQLQSLRDFRGKKACFAGVGTLAGWVLPISKLMKEGGMDIVDCNNHVKSAMAYFGPSCSVNSLSDKYNPLGDNSDQLCQICGSSYPGVRCTSNDPYAGYQGALSCLLDQGDIAFVKHSSVLEYFNQRPNYDLNSANNFTAQGNSFGNFFPTTSPRPFFPLQPAQNFPFNQPPQTPAQGLDAAGQRSWVTDGSTVRLAADRKMSLAEFKENFELFCPNGERRSVEDWRSCSWAQLPSHAVVTSSAKSVSLRLRYQRFLQNLVEQMGGSGSVTPSPVFGQALNTAPQPVSLFESSPRFGNRSNLLFQDATAGLRSIPEPEQTYRKYLGESEKDIMDIRSCPVGRVTLCVTSEAEMTKCVKMRTALNAQLLKPEMSCYKGHSHLNCMQAIRNGDADAAVFDAGDIYKGGLQFELIPVLSEIYNLEVPEYYAVAVAYQGDAETELTYLKGKRSCHSGIGHGAGWVIPMAYLLSSGRMRSYGCDSVMAASQYFSKACVPGALSKENNFGQEHNNLCDLCHGSSFSYCSRDASEDFYGYTGALRCLIEGGGQVAFVKHTTVSEVADGKRKETWARNILSGDYELLCRDGTRAPVTEFERCNLGRVKANAVVIRGGQGYNDTEANAIINLFLYAQQFYGRKIEDDFNFGMFYSAAPYSDLIFQDAAQQLRVIPLKERHYQPYLGQTFLRNMGLVDCRAAVSALGLNVSLLFGLTLLLLSAQHLT